MASTAGKEKIVLKVLADLYSRPQGYLYNRLQDWTPAMSNGLELIEIPNISSVTTAAVYSSGDDVQSISAQQLAPTLLELKLDQNRGVFILREDQRNDEYMLGMFYEQAVMQSAIQLANYRDENVADYLSLSLAYNSSGTYHDNVAADDLTAGDIASALAALESNDGMVQPAFFVHPYGMANLRKISGWQPNGAAVEAGMVGIPQIGTLMGHPVYQSNSLNRSRTIAASASAISSNVLTCTVAAGHGVVPGMKITTAGGTTDVDTAAAVTTVGATSIAVPLTASNDAANGALTITVESVENLLVDVGNIYVASKSVMPKFREVPVAGSVSTELQLWNRWGRVGRAGRARVFHSPVAG